MRVAVNDDDSEQKRKLNEIDSHGKQSVNSSTHIHKSKGRGSSQSVRVGYGVERRYRQHRANNS